MGSCYGAVALGPKRVLDMVPLLLDPGGLLLGTSTQALSQPRIEEYATERTSALNYGFPASKVN